MGLGRPSTSPTSPRSLAGTQGLGCCRLSAGPMFPQALALGTGSLRLHPWVELASQAGAGTGPSAESLRKLRPDCRTFLRFQVLLSRAGSRPVAGPGSPRPESQPSRAEGAHPHHWPLSAHSLVGPTLCGTQPAGVRACGRRGEVL